MKIFDFAKRKEKYLFYVCIKKRVSSIFYSTRLIKFTLPRTFHSHFLWKDFFFNLGYPYKHNIFYIYSMSLIFLNTVYLNLERFSFVLRGLDWVLLYSIEDLSIKMLDLHLLNINALLVFLFFFYILECLYVTLLQFGTWDVIYFSNRI